MIEESHTPAEPESGPVSLPMHDWPEVRAATDILWAAIADRLRKAGIAAPARLRRTDGDEAGWTDPDLLLSQTCGYPLVARLGSSVRYLATPHYDAPDCVEANYCSLVIALPGRGRNLSDFQGARIAFNGPDSLSGHVALRAAIAGAGFDPGSFGTWQRTGGHRNSLEAVANGRADLAAIDAVSFALATDHMPQAIERIKIIATTAPLPGLPFITAARRGDTVPLIREALLAAFADPDLAAVRRRLRITGLSVLAEDAYAVVAATARQAGL